MQSIIFICTNLLLFKSHHLQLDASLDSFGYAEVAALKIEMYEKILARSFSRYEQRKFVYAAFIAFLLVAASLCTLFKPTYFRPLLPVELQLDPLDQLPTLPLTSDSVSPPLQPILNHPENVTLVQPVLANHDENTTMVKSQPVEHGVVKSEISCNFTLPRSNSCTIIGDVRVNGVAGTISVPQNKPDKEGNMSETYWKLKPYARKTDTTAMKFVREWSVKHVFETQNLPKCSLNHSVPAIIFTNGGYNGNHFHDSTDTLIPLFLSATRLDGEVKFLVTNHKISWLNKYTKILKKLSKYEIIDIDKESDIHCFPKVILGLTSQKEFDINPSMPPYLSQKDYTTFIRDAFSLPRSTAINLSTEKTQKPRLMIISRKATRRLINIRNVIKLGKNLGYEVIVAEGNNTSDLAAFAESMNSCDVLLGIHGAGLTNIVFLPENAVFIQIVPLGVEWISDLDFGQPARDMNLRYLDYQITKEESSLLQQYPADHIVFKNPYFFQQQSWFAFRAIYLDKQDIKIDVRRLKPLLVKAIELLHR